MWKRKPENLKARKPEDRKTSSELRIETNCYSFSRHPTPDTLTREPLNREQ